MYLYIKSDPKGLSVSALWLQRIYSVYLGLMVNMAATPLYIFFRTKNAYDFDIMYHNGLGLIIVYSFNDLLLILTSFTPRQNFVHYAVGENIIFVSNSILKFAIIIRQSDKQFFIPSKQCNQTVFSSYLEAIFVYIHKLLANIPVQISVERLQDNCSTGI